MPNWCNNTLRITGDSQQIEQLPWVDLQESAQADSSIHTTKLFQPLLPCPDGLNGQEQIYWSLENWGVKWDCSVEIVDFGDDFVELQFDTPWNSPLNAIAKISSMFPLLVFEMQSGEPGCDWQGKFLWQQGNLAQQVNGSYYAQSPETCPDCHADYYPEIDLSGDITYRECLDCSWSDSA